MTISYLKKKISLIFDGEISAKFWQNVVEYVIIGLIIISTVEVFLTTFENIVEKYGHVLRFIDIFTTIVFTIEVSLRIWVADEIDAKYKGLKGRLRYCFSFYGLIDILSTYPFYLDLLFPLPYQILKTLRIARLFRIFRYLKSFNLLSTAVSSKKSELWISVQFLFIITVILSFILFFVEHNAQPDVYENGFYPVIWAFAQYIGDPGHFAEIPPITLTGRITACIIGVLGIALFAVPAGLIGAGFTEAMDNDKKNQEISNNIESLNLAFERRLCRLTKFRVVPSFVSVSEIQTLLEMSTDNIIEAVRNSNKFRLVNLAITQNVNEHPEDRLVVEHFCVNRSYGCFINRDSKITIVSTSSCVEPAIGNFSYYVAKIGGFNYISREVGSLPPYQSYYLIDEENSDPHLPLFMEDLNSLAYNNDNWVIFLLSASGAREPSYPTQFHFSYGGKKGDETYNDIDNLMIHNIPSFNSMFTDFSTRMQKEFELDCDRQRHYDSASKKIIARHLNYTDKVNSIIIRIAWSVTCWDIRRIQIAQVIADSFGKYLDTSNKNKISPSDLTKSGFGYEENL